MPFQIRYFREGLLATRYVATAQTMFEARRLAAVPEMAFDYDLAVIEAPDGTNNYRTIDILRHDS